MLLRIVLFNCCQGSIPHLVGLRINWDLLYSFLDHWLHNAHWRQFNFMCGVLTNSDDWKLVDFCAEGFQSTRTCWNVTFFKFNSSSFTSNSHSLAWPVCVCLVFGPFMLLSNIVFFVVECLTHMLHLPPSMIPLTSVDAYTTVQA